MDKRNRHFAFLSMILIALFASAVSFGCSPATDSDDTTEPETTEVSGEPYVIGAVLSLTGA